MRAATPTKSALRPDLPNTLVKAKSASHLGRMAMLGTPPRGRSAFDTDSNLNTLPDPRTPSPAPRTPSDETRHPDLSSEVAMLSTKLINAINHQTNLDDSLQQTRHELEAARRKIADYEAESQEHVRLIATGALVRKDKFDEVVGALRTELLETQSQKQVAEKSRKEMEVELETLTTALFEEANTVQHIHVHPVWFSGTKR